MLAGLETLRSILVLACLGVAGYWYIRFRRWKNRSSDDENDEDRRLTPAKLGHSDSAWSVFLHGPRDRLSDLLAGEVIAVRYRAPRGEIKTWTRRVEQVFREFHNPYIAVSDEHGGQYIVRLDRMVAIATGSDGQVFDCYEDWFADRGVEFEFRGKRSSSSIPSNPKFFERG